MVFVRGEKRGADSLKVGRALFDYKAVYNYMICSFEAYFFEHQIDPVEAEGVFGPKQIHIGSAKARSVTNDDASFACVNSPKTADVVSIGAP
ncbi:hypothetical protein MPRF_56660 [Mycolicibacterium parafortuitum]|uniref:Uncharacterized protein n=1 Tax=Mycolicibacterium parafortuitum TaxID=39692 RepID=A0A7I7UBZ8_MYCPF|nr:hypothetical protein MPRF_56660 [Mycolicibacterium parafortuitum]